MSSDLLWFWGLPHGPHLHRVQAEVLLLRQLGAAIGGAPGPCTAVTAAKITVQPQAEVPVLTPHTLRETTWRVRKEKHDLSLKCFSFSPTCQSSANIVLHQSSMKAGAFLCQNVLFNWWSWKYSKHEYHLLRDKHSLIYLFLENKKHHTAGTVSKDILNLCLCAVWYQQKTHVRFSERSC